MKLHLIIALAGSAIGLTLPAFAQQKDTVNPKIAQQIRALASKYDAAFNRDDAAAVATLYTEDVVFKTPNGTFNGRQAIEELFAKH
jgi:ketosteroid isomerase-like protein